MSLSMDGRAPGELPTTPQFSENVEHDIHIFNIDLDGLPSTVRMSKKDWLRHSLCGAVVLKPHPISPNMRCKLRVILNLDVVGVSSFETVKDIY